MIPGASYLTIGLGIALGVSVLATAGMTHLYLGARDEKTEALADRDSARDAANICSRSVASLDETARKRAAESADAVAAAFQRGKEAQGKATRILTAPQKVPGNVCASAQAEVDEFIQERDGP